MYLLLLIWLPLGLLRCPCNRKNRDLGEVKLSESGSWIHCFMDKEIEEYL